MTATLLTFVFLTLGFWIQDLICEWKREDFKRFYRRGE